MSERTKALAYIAEIRDHLRMQGWTIHLHLDDGGCDEEESWAKIRPDTNHHSASLWLSDLFFDTATPAVRRNVIVHELVHLMHRDVGELMDTKVVDHPAISFREAEGIREDFHVHMERFVSWVAGQLAPSCPQWPGTYKKPTAGVCMADDVNQA